MDRRLRDLAAHLRSMPSSDAADWLLGRYCLERDDWGEALTLIDHASFHKRDARRMAEYYLSNAPYASDRPYQLFAKLLGVGELFRILSGIVPVSHERRDLLLYHLKPLFDAAESDTDRAAVSAFVGASNLSA